VPPHLILCNSLCGKRASEELGVVALWELGSGSREGLRGLLGFS